MTDPDTGDLTEPEEVRAEWLGDPVDPVRIWQWCRAIRREEYLNLVDLHRTTGAMAATHAPIDLTETIVQPRSGF